MSFTVHVTMVTTPELFKPDVRNYLKDNFQAGFERTSEGDFYGWSMHNKAIHDPYISALFEMAYKTNVVVVRLESPEVNDEVDVF